MLEKFRKMLFKNGRYNEIVEFWDVIAEGYKIKTDEEITFKMISRGVRRDG